MTVATSSFRENHWRSVLQRYAESHVSIRQFCRQEHISQASFYAWRRRLAPIVADVSESQSPPSNRVPSAKRHAFIPLQLVDTVSSMELIHPHGCRIRFTGEVDAQALQRILEVLDIRSDT